MNTGFQELDVILKGLKPGSCNLIGGRPAMGKSGFALQIAAHVATEEKKKVAYFSLDIPKEQVKERFFLMRKSINFTELGRNLMVDDTAFLTVNELHEKCKAMSLTTGLDLVIVDYLQLLEIDADSKGKYSSRKEEVLELSRGLKALAEKLQIPVVVVSMLPRNMERRKDHRPRISDLRVNQTDSIEPDCDVILFIYRDGYYNPYSKIKDVAEIIIAKNRYGEAEQTVLLGWDYTRRSFQNRIVF